MAILFECPFCRAKLQLPDEMAGKQAVCGGCEKLLQVPAAEVNRPAVVLREVPPRPMPLWSVVLCGAGLIFASVLLLASVVLLFTIPVQEPRALGRQAPDPGALKIRAP